MEGLGDNAVREAEDNAETERVLGLVMKSIEGDLREVALTGSSSGIDRVDSV